MDLTRLSAALVVLGNAILTAVIVVGDLEWSDAQKGAAYVAVNTSVALGVSLYAHFRPTQPRYPVAVGVSLVAWTESGLTVLTVFTVWGLTAAKAAVLQAIVVSAVALVALFVTQSKTTPVADAVARERQARDSWRRNPAAKAPDGHAR